MKFCDILNIIVLQDGRTPREHQAFWYVSLQRALSNGSADREAATMMQRPNNVAADLKPQGEASAKVKVCWKHAHIRALHHSPVCACEDPH